MTNQLPSGLLVPDSVDAAVEDLLAFSAENVPRFPTGYSLDDTCGMIAQSELGLMWARSASGKSTWMLNVIRESQDVPTVVFNMEMTARRQVEWLVSMTFDLGTPAFDVEEVLRRGSLDPRNEELVRSLKEMSLRYPHLNFVSPPSPPTVEDLARSVDAIEDRSGTRPQRVFVDHLSLMKGARNYEDLTKTAALLHTWAMSDELAVIAIQQTGRGGGEGVRNDGHVPVTLSSGVYGGEDAADWIWGMHRPERDPKFHKLGLRGALTADKYEKLMLEHAEVEGITVLQLIKNRPYGETRDRGIDLRYDSYNRRLREER